MSAMNNGSLQPTWVGHVANTRDALILFEACLNGNLHHVPRRPHDRERSSLIKSGCVFIYEENASGIKRWTDGVPWSPSRILGNFLVYRELMKPFPPGEKKRATKRNKRPAKPGEPYPRPGGETGSQSSLGMMSPTSPETPGSRSDGGIDNKESERALIGSLIDSYGFKEGGLVKKTMSVNVHGVHHHLVSYYTIKEVMDGVLHPPSQDPRLMHLEPRADLITRQNFRAPLDDVDDGMQDPMDGSHHMGYGYDANGYDRRPPTLIGQGPHSHQPPMGGYYPNMAYSGAVPHGIPGYASIPGAIPSTAGFYPPTHAPSQAVAPKQEDFGSYNRGSYTTAQFESRSGPSTDRPTSQPHQMAPYPFRPMTGGAPRPSGMMESSHAMDDGKAIEHSEWRGGAPGGVYAPSLPPSTPSNNAAPAYSNGQSWSSMTSTAQTIPRGDSSTYYQGSEHQNWSMQTPVNARQTSFHSQSHTE